MNYLPLMAKTFPPAEKSAIDALERKIGLAFPADYREFLLQSDGGMFAKETVLLDETGADTILNAMNRVADDPDCSIERDYDLFRSMDRIPRFSIPIADDPGGNRFLISLEPETSGEVFFWDHENEPEDGGEAFSDFRNLTRVGRSFEGFVTGLRGEGDE